MPDFIKRDQPGRARTHHLHMITEAAEFGEHWRALLFGDYLRAHPAVARDYGALKVRLAEEHRHDHIAYTRGKSEFIAEVIAKLDTA